MTLQKKCRWSNSFQHAELLDGTFDFFIKNIYVCGCLYILIILTLSSIFLKMTLFLSLCKEKCREIAQVVLSFFVCKRQYHPFLFPFPVTLFFSLPLELTLKRKEKSVEWESIAVQIEKKEEQLQRMEINENRCGKKWLDDNKYKYTLHTNQFNTHSSLKLAYMLV